MRRTLIVGALLALFSLGACDSGPAGPGTLTVAVDAPISLGAVQLSITGKGVTGVRALSGIEVAARMTLDTEKEQTWRVVAFSPTGQAIRLAVDVESTDTSLEMFASEAADQAGQLVGVAGVDLRVER